MADGENIEMAIEVVGAAGDETLAEQLRDYLMGEVDGTSKVSTAHASQVATLQHHLLVAWGRSSLCYWST